MITLAFALALGTVFMGGHNLQATAKEPKILELDTMIGLPLAFTGTQQPIRGINGDVLPWAMDPATAN